MKVTADTHTMTRANSLSVRRMVTGCHHAGGPGLWYNLHLCLTSPWPFPALLQHPGAGSWGPGTALRRPLPQVDCCGCSPGGPSRRWGWAVFGAFLSEAALSEDPEAVDGLCG